VAPTWFTVKVPGPGAPEHRADCAERPVDLVPAEIEGLAGQSTTVDSLKLLGIGTVDAAWTSPTHHSN